MMGAGVIAAQVSTVASERINVAVDIALFPSKKEYFWAIRLISKNLSGIMGISVFP